MKTVLIGAGYRGMALLRLMKDMPFFELAAVADPALTVAGAGVLSAGQAAAPLDGLKIYAAGPEDYRRMLAEQKPELAVVCSPWHLHIPQAAECLKAGCNVALEIRGGGTEGEYAPLEALCARPDGPKVFPMENLIFRRDILAVREMARSGLFGEIVSMKGGYHHDLRDELVDARGILGGSAMGDAHGKTHEAWRGKAYTTANGDIYPTHSIAPLCLIGGIHAFATVNSTASKAAGLREKLGPACPPITLGDIVTTNVLTPDGVLLSITHDTTLPRPKSFGIEVQGTKGIWDEGARRIYIEGRSPRGEWESDAAYVEEFLDPLWRRWGAEAVKADAHHGGMDYIMLKAMEKELSGEEPYPARLSDLALWTSVTPLSCKSIAEGRAVKAAL